MSEEKKDQELMRHRDMPPVSSKPMSDQYFSPTEYENNNYPIPQESRIEPVLEPSGPFLLKALEDIKTYRPYSKEEKRQVMWDASRQTCEVCGVKMTTSVYDFPKKCEQCSRR